MLGMTFDQTVNLRGAIGGHTKKIFGKSSNLGVYGTAFAPKRAAHVFRILPAHVGLKQHLQDKFAGFAARAHGSSRWSFVVGRWP